MAYAIQRINANRIGRMVSMPQWGGGMHREHLEYLLGVTPENRKTYQTCLMVAYKRGLICFCGQYVCATPPAMGQTDLYR